MRANQLLKNNVIALLKARGNTRKDLAQWCYRGESWISKILKEPRREFPNKYLDRIADFFGLATYQLFQPGLTHDTERRRSERRVGKDRRMSHAQRTMVTTAAEINKARVVGKGRDVEEAPRQNDPVHRLVERFVRELDPLLSQASAGRQAPVARRAQPRSPSLRRARGGQDDPGHSSQ
jgi:hypothetical protein